MLAIGGSTFTTELLSDDHSVDYVVLMCPYVQSAVG